MTEERSNILILDLETQKTFDEVGRQNLHKLKVSVVGTYDYQTGQYASYEEHEIHALEERLKTVDLLVGFNVRRFDLAVLQPYLFMSADSVPVLDLLEEIEKVRGHRVSLQSLAQATLDDSKTGQGIDAVSLYRRGQMDTLKQYCLTDVRITKDLFEYGKVHQKVYFISNRDWKKYEIPVQWGDAAVSKKESAFPTSLF